MKKTVQLSYRTPYTTLGVVCTTFYHMQPWGNSPRLPGPYFLFPAQTKKQKVINRKRGWLESNLEVFNREILTY